jgi:hypothetical protein
MGVVHKIPFNIKTAGKLQETAGTVETLRKLQEN